MSLRSQIRNAIDEVAPPTPDLEHKVRAYVLGDRKARRVLRLQLRRSPWVYRFQGAATILAAALVIALVAGVFLGGRFLRDLRSTPTPAPSIKQGELKRLEARPLVALPDLPADGVCPIGPLGTNASGLPAIGSGPIHTMLAMDEVYNSDWGTWTLTWFAVDPTAKRLFLVRAWDLESKQPVFFAGNLSGTPDAQMGRAVFAGTVAGHDHVNGQTVPFRTELAIDASAPSDWAKTPSKGPVWGAYVGYPRGASGCILFQVDSAAEDTETFVRAY